MFEKLKQRLLDRIEKDAVKSEMTYHINEGTKKNPKIKSITETVYIRRSKMPLTGDWQRIYPPVNEDGTLNIVNFIFSGKKNLIRLLFVAGIITIVLLGFQELFNYINYLEEFCPREIISTGYKLP